MARTRGESEAVTPEEESGKPVWARRLMERADAIERSLYEAPKDGINALEVVRVQASVDRAREATSRPGLLSRLLPGEAEKEAKSHLDLAESHLIGIMGDEQLRSRARSTLGPTAAGQAEAGVSGRTDVGKPPIEELQSLMLGRIDARAAERDRSRAIRVWLVTACLVLTGALLIVFIFLDGTGRAALAVGAAAGLVSAAPRLKRTGAEPPYESLGLVAWTKLLGGSLAAALALFLLHWGFGALEPARGRAAIFYAAIFGFAQQLATGPFDRWLERRAKGTGPGGPPGRRQANRSCGRRTGAHGR
jgi:hypothetical protein